MSSTALLSQIPAARCFINTGRTAERRVYPHAEDVPEKFGGGCNSLEINSFTSTPAQMGFAPQFWQDVFAEVRQTINTWKRSNGRMEVEISDQTGEYQLLTRAFANGRFEVIAENLCIRNVTANLKFTRPFKNFSITSSFPFYPGQITENGMLIRCSANRGMCSVELEEA